MDNTMNKTLLICDMDGTLLNSERKLESDRVRSIEAFIKKGGLFTIATGRMESTTLKHFKHLPVNVPAIFYNGAQIFDMEARKTLWQDLLPDNAREIVKKILEKWPGVGCEVLRAGEIHVLKQNQFTQDQMAREGFVPVYSTLNHCGDQWFKVLFAAERQILNEIHTEIQQDFILRKKYGVGTVFSEENLLELLNLGTSKGKALRQLSCILKDRGIQIERIIAVGDGMNDMELIGEADLGIAVENACNELKEIADAVIGSHNGNIIDEVLKSFF